MLLDEIVERLESWEEGKPQGPLRMELHPTDRCNLRCIFCWRAGSGNKNFPEMSERRLLKIPEEAAKLGVKEWIVSGGGEPLVRKEATLKVLRAIKQFNMWGLLTTNGTLLTRKDIEFMIRIGWDQVQFSIDGPTKEINDYLRPPNSFERIIRAVKLFSRLKKKLKSEKPYIGFNTILTRLNYDKLDAMIKLASSVGSQLVYVEPLYPGYTEERLDLNEEERKKLNTHIKRALKVSRKLNVDTNLQTFLETHLVDKTEFRKKVLEEVKNMEGFKAVPCFRPWYLMGVKASGFAGCCSTFEVGEFINKKSLREVWFGKLFNKIRDDMMKKRIPPYCSKCSVVVLMENRELRRMLGWRRR